MARPGLRSLLRVAVGRKAQTDEESLIQHLDMIDAESDSFMRDSGFDDNSRTWEAFRDGDYWRNPSEEPLFMANVLGNSFERKTATLTQSKPTYRVAARSKILGKPASVLTDTLRALNDEIQLMSRIERAADFAGTYGHVGFNTAWDPTALYGQGNITTGVIDPRLLRVDPRIQSTDDIPKAQYIRVETPMPLWLIKETWPGRGGDVVADADLSTFFEESKMVMPHQGSLRRVYRGTRGSDSPYAWARVYEYWYVSDAKDGRNKMVFPAGRLTHRAGSTVLDDMANPYWDGGWPIDVWDWRVKARSYQGRSDMEEGRKLQEIFARLGHILSKNMFLNGTINIVADWNAMSAKDWAALDNRIARIIKKNPGKEVKFEPPPAFPAQYVEFMQMMPTLIDRLLGTVDPSTSPGVSAAAIEGLQVAQEVLVRSNARRLEYCIERIGQKQMSRVIQFYDGDRIMHVIGDDGEVSDYLFKRAELVDADGNQIDDIEPEKRREFFQNFAFRVIPMSSLPQNKTQRALLAQEMFKLGIVDAEEVLKMADYPDWKNIQERVKQKIATGEMPNPAMQEQDKKGGKGGRGRTNSRGSRMQMS